MEHKKSIGLPAQLCFLAVLWVLGTSKVFAEVEIDLDEASKPASAPMVKWTPTPANASHKMPTEVPTPTLAPQMGVGPTPEPTATPVPENEEVDVEESPRKPEIVHGVLKMKDVYQAGIKSYQEKDYDQSIRYFKKAVAMKDKYTPKFYYAEAYATLGVIYQFHIVRYKTAYTYYKLALKYERNNRTARKHLKEVAKKLHKRS